MPQTFFRYVCFSIKLPPSYPVEQVGNYLLRPVVWFGLNWVETKISHQPLLHRIRDFSPSWFVNIGWKMESQSFTPNRSTVGEELSWSGLRLELKSPGLKPGSNDAILVSGLSWPSIRLKHRPTFWNANMLFSNISVKAPSKENSYRVEEAFFSS